MIFGFVTPAVFHVQKDRINRKKIQELSRKPSNMGFPTKKIDAAC